jgi:hypothetical protein
VQVRAALATDPANVDLLKLEADLQDIIALSSELDSKPAPKQETDWNVVSGAVGV